MNRRNKFIIFGVIGIIVFAITIELARRHSAAKFTPIDGVFEIRLGMTESEIRQVVDTTYLKPEYGWDAYADINWKGFELEKYKVDDYYEIEDIHLELFNDSLYYIRITKYNKKTEDLLTEKYGVLYENTHASVRSMTSSRYKKWNRGDQDIKCESEYEEDFSRHEKQVTYFLELYDSRIKGSLDEIMDRYHKQKRSAEKEQRKTEYQKLIDKL